MGFVLGNPEFWTTDKPGRQRQINIIMAVKTVEDKRSVTNYFVQRMVKNHRKSVTQEVEAFSGKKLSPKKLVLRVAVKVSMSFQK